MSARILSAPALRSYVSRASARVDVDQTDPDSIDAAASYVVEHEQDLPSYFISAMSISAEQHVHVLAAAQRNVDNSVSKTCNGAVNDTLESVDHLYRLARQLGCKAVSYYRDGSRENQVLTSMKQEVKNEPTTVVTTTTVVEALEESVPGGTDQRMKQRRDVWRKLKQPRESRARFGSSVHANFGRDLADSVRRPEPLRHRQSRWPDDC